MLDALPPREAQRLKQSSSRTKFSVSLVCYLNKYSLMEKRFLLITVQPISKFTNNFLFRDPFQSLQYTLCSKEEINGKV